MRILFLSPVGSVGGAERMLLTAISSLRRAQPSWPIGVIVMGDGALAASAKRLGAEVIICKMPLSLSRMGDSRLGATGRLGAVARLAMSALPAMSYLRQIRSAIRDWQPDVLHSNGLKAHLWSSMIGRTKCAIAWHLHDFYSRRSLAATCLRIASRKAAVGIAISKAVANDARSILAARKIKVLPNAIDTAVMAPRMGPHLEGLASGVARAKVIKVGLVATYARWKGHMVVLQAAAELAAQQPDVPVRWYIVGGAIYSTDAQYTEGELREAAERLKVSHLIQFVPFQSDVAGIYNSMDIVVHASTSPEPFGLTIAEGMACGRAVVASDGGAVSELIINGRTGVVVRAGDPTSLARAVEQLACDPGLRCYLGEQARAVAVERFSDLNYGQQLIDIYRSVLPVG